jgi:hypothetical protein
MSLKYTFGDPSQFIGAVINPLADALKKPLDQKQQEMRAARLRAARKTANPKNATGDQQKNPNVNDKQFTISSQLEELTNQGLITPTVPLKKKGGAAPVSAPRTPKSGPRRSAALGGQITKGQGTGTPSGPRKARSTFVSPKPSAAAKTAKTPPAARPTKASAAGNRTKNSTLIKPL